MNKELAELIKLILKLIKGLGSPFKGEANLPSPRMDIEFEDIIYDKENRELIFTNIEPDIKIQTVQNTNSMEPFVDVGHMMILSNNKIYMDDLNVGDVIIWEMGRGRIIHTIVMIGDDGEWYCRTQGVNLNNVDPEIIRKRHIQDVVLFPVWSKKKGIYVSETGD